MGEVKGSVLERLKGAFIKYVTLIGGFFDPLVLLNGCFTYNFRQSITKVCASPPPQKKYGQKTEQKYMFYRFKKIWFLNGLPIHMIRPFKNRAKKCLKSQMFGLQVSSIQMVTVQHN